MRRVGVVKTRIFFLLLLQVKNHIWDRAQNWTIFGTGWFVVIKSDVAGHFESYKARILPLYVRRASMWDTNLD